MVTCLGVANPWMLAVIWTLSLPPRKSKWGYQEGSVGSDQEPPASAPLLPLVPLKTTDWPSPSTPSFLMSYWGQHKWQCPCMNCCFRIYPRQTLMSKLLGKWIQFLLNSISIFKILVQWHGSRVSLWDSNMILPLRDELLTWGGGSEEFWPQRPPTSLCSIS